MKQLIKQQVNNIKQIANYNSKECIYELNYLNTLISESELPLETVKHLPSELNTLLNQLLKEIGEQK